MLTLYSVNMKSVTHPCADRLIFRDFKNDLTILDVNANRLKATGNYTSTRGKGYLCQLQFQVVFNTIPNEDIQMQLYLWYILFPRWEMSLYPPEYFRRRPICWPLSTSMRYVPLHFISNPARPCSTADTISFTHCIFADLPALMSQSTASLTYRKCMISARYPNNVHDFLNNIINQNRQYFEDEDKVSPLICAWDFVIQRESKRIAGNETAALTLNVRIINLRVN